jgi:hypothetical protein
MQHSSSKWLGRSFAALAALAVPAGMALGAENGLVRICYHGSEASVAQNALGDYLADGATRGTCADAQAAQQAQASAASSSASSQPSAPGIFGMTDAMPSSQAASSPLWWEDQAPLQADESSDDNGEHNRMSVSISTNLNGRQTQRRQVWENGELVLDTANGVGVDLGFPFGSLGLGF